MRVDDLIFYLLCESDVANEMECVNINDPVFPFSYQPPYISPIYFDNGFPRIGKSFRNLLTSDISSLL